jgi:hypothetical protein
MDRGSVENELPRPHGGVVDLPLVERLLRESLPFEHRVVNVYLVGSRAYGLATPDSDYDVTVVIESAYDLLGLQFLSFGEWNLNLNIFHLAFFRNLIQQNVVWILVVGCPPRGTLRAYVFYIVVRNFALFILFLFSRCCTCLESLCGRKTCVSHLGCGR